MGDHVYASIEIGGHIETVEQAETLITALVAEGFADQKAEVIIRSTEDGMTVLRSAVEAGATIECYGMEVNYGNFDEMDKVATTLTSLWFSTAYGSGAGFSEGRKTIVAGEVFSCMTNEGNAVVLLSELETVINGNNPDTIAFELTRIVTRVQREAGQGLPVLTASPAVAAWLKIFGDKAA